jgi:Fe(3+) dicitrate transport protein
LDYVSTGAVGAGDNRVGEAEALSFWAQDRMILDRWQVTTSLRYEDIKTVETRYSDGKPRNVVSGVPKRYSTEELMAGIGATYALTDAVTLLGGVHQGFTPAGAGGTTKPEESVNWELGGRYRSGDRSVDAIAFFSDYSNILQDCSVSAPCAGGVTTGSVQAGKAEVLGLELAYRDVLYRSGSWSVPARLTWTWTDAEISGSAITGSGDPDIAESGDGLPYLAEQMVAVTVGLDNGTGWASYLSGTLRDGVCITYGCDRVNDPRLGTDTFWTLDLASHYQLTQSAEVYARVENLLDEQAIASRSPAGVRVNMPRYAGVGFKVKF